MPQKKIQISQELENWLFAWFVYFEATVKTFLQEKAALLKFVVNCVPAVQTSNRGHDLCDKFHEDFFKLTSMELCILSNF